MAMEAAVRGDVTLLMQAMLHDPLVGAVCSPEEVWQMTDELLAALAPWLPQYGDEPAAAAQRLAEAQRNGTRVPLRDTTGAVRLPMLTIEQMALDPAEANANAGAADKGKMTKEPAAH
jgi:alpha-galactosidase